MKLGLKRYDAGELPQDALATVSRLFDVTEPGAVFSAPVKVGDHTVITAAEISVGVGVGVGQGPDSQAGGGGGGFSAGRPVAAISIGPQGVHVEPIVDVTKLGIAFFTALGAIFMARRAMRRAGRG